MGKVGIRGLDIIGDVGFGPVAIRADWGIDAKREIDFQILDETQIDILFHGQKVGYAGEDGFVAYNGTQIP